jgi:hypothetical protein
VCATFQPSRFCRFTAFRGSPKKILRSTLTSLAWVIPVTQQTFAVTKQNVRMFGTAPFLIHESARLEHGLLTSCSARLAFEFAKQPNVDRNFFTFC